MRVLLASNSYPPVLGGLQVVTHTLARRLIQAGHAVRVVANRYPRSLLEAEMLDGVSIQRWLFLAPGREQLKRGRPDLFLASFYYYPSVRGRFARLLRDFHPQVVNVHFPDAQIPFILALRRRFDFRLVVSLHGDEIERWFSNGSPPGMGSRPYLGRLRAILRQADAVTACSQHLLARAIQIEPAVAQKGRAIHNGIQLERFQDRTPYPYPRSYVFSYGRLTPKKGFDLLLSAFARIALDHPGLDLILAGEGQARPVLEAQARQLGLAERVVFFGRAASEEVVRLLNGASLVVIPSRQEPFGIAALEAMAAGKLVLATRVGGLPEFLRQPPNCLVEPSVEGIARGLERLLQFDALDEMGRKNRERAAEFTWSRVAERYLQVLKSHGSP